MLLQRQTTHQSFSGHLDEVTSDFLALKKKLGLMRISTLHSMNFSVNMLSVVFKFHHALSGHQQFL